MKLLVILIFTFIGHLVQATTDFAFVGFSPNLDVAAWEELRWNPTIKEITDKIYIVRLGTGELLESFSASAKVQKINPKKLKASAKNLRKEVLKKSLPRLKSLKLSIASGFKKTDLANGNFWYEKLKGKDIKFNIRKEEPAKSCTQCSRLCRDLNLSLEVLYNNKEGKYVFAFEALLPTQSFVEKCIYSYEIEKLYTVFNGVKRYAAMFIRATGGKEHIFPIFFSYKGVQ